MSKFVIVAALIVIVSGCQPTPEQQRAARAIQRMEYDQEQRNRYPRIKRMAAQKLTDEEKIDFVKSCDEVWGTLHNDYQKLAFEYVNDLLEREVITAKQVHEFGYLSAIEEDREKMLEAMED